MKNLRCAVYTRKSSEEGLEQSFNSIDAQREACCAFILSQKHQGWMALTERYDDGGFSGASMDRPALQRLLEDIRNRKVDIVMVYKVDRLTRSLSDFARIIEIFDAVPVSFVSVTQQFNTTNSMGRLTLNVLLSFAQFEREITGERIRDKIAASKKKGMWMGGTLPLGYDCIDRRLVVNETEADKVRKIFQAYERFRSVLKLERYLREQQITSKTWKTGRGHTRGGKPFGRGALYHLLGNPVYLGHMRHGQQTYPGQHSAIISQELWGRVAAQLQITRRRAAGCASGPSLLRGVIYDARGVAFTPTHAVKRGKRYRYYTSQSAIRNDVEKPAISRFPAQELEDWVRRQVITWLKELTVSAVAIEEGPESELIVSRARQWATQEKVRSLESQDQFLRKVLGRVVVGPNTIELQMDRRSLVKELLGKDPDGALSTVTLKRTRPFVMQRRRGEIQIIPPESNEAQTTQESVVRIIMRARKVYEGLVGGRWRSLREVAKESRYSHSYAKHVLHCINFSPRIKLALLSGQHPPLRLRPFLKNVPLTWAEQERIFFSPTEPFAGGFPKSS